MWIHPEGKAVEREELLVPIHGGTDVGEGSSRGKAKGKAAKGRGGKGKQVQEDDEDEDNDKQEESAGTDVSDRDEDDAGPPQKRARLNAPGSRALRRGGNGEETMASELLASAASVELELDPGADDVVEAGSTMREALGSGYPSGACLHTFSLWLVN